MGDIHCPGKANEEIEKDVKTAQMKLLKSKSQQRLKRTIQLQMPASQIATLAINDPTMTLPMHLTLQRLQQTPLAILSIVGLRLPPYQLTSPKCYYDGQWRDGKFFGKGKLYTPETYSEGYFIDGLLHCEDGIKIWNNGSYYRGNFNRGKMEGRGVYEGKDDAKYEGQWKNNQPEGYGIQIIPDELIYKGYFHRGKRSGKGEIVWANGDSYKGQFLYGKMHGQGKLTVGGEIFEGKMQENMRAEGRLQNEQGVYLGKFMNNQMQDINGYFKYKKINAEYQGMFRKGEKHGRGRIIYKNGKIQDGEWEDGKIITKYTH